MTDPVSHLNAALEGRYTIERELGEGGMATVYLARDEKHNRNVALKVLKPELAAVVGAERFLAEIETTANLQHPHILPLFDSGEADSFLFYVMPYIEGETLRDRIDREKQLPVDEALGIATAVAHALRTAHDAGVIHRDIKPGNILMSRGQPLVSDFGIALAVGTAGGGRLTETGLSVGTPFYMSPEQATGDQQVGPQTDTYALACVLYEMLTGDPPYVGSTAQAVLGKIIQGTPVSATAARKTVPHNVDAALRKALERLPADRFTRADDFAKALADPSFRHGEDEAAVVAAGSAFWKRTAIAASTAAVALAVGLIWALTRPAPPALVERYESPFREGQGPLETGPAGFELSRDGTMLAYVGPGSEGFPQIWIRRWDDPEAFPVRGTERGGGPTFSPDGSELAFHRLGDTFVVPLDGGPVRRLGFGVMPYWGEDGYIYSHEPVSSAPAQRTPASGGTAEPVSTNDRTTGRHFVEQLLPGDEIALMVVQSDTELETHALDLSTGESRFLVRGSSPAYSPTGHLLFESEATLMAVPFDPSSAEVIGSPVALVDSVNHVSLSQTGRLVYSRGLASADGGDNRQLVWITRSGQATPVEEGWTFNSGLGNEGWALSPDGTQIALRNSVDGNQDIWIKDLPAGPLRRITFASTEQRVPFWAPDGNRVLYLSESAEGGWEVRSAAANGTGEPEIIVHQDPGVAQATLSPDGNVLVLRTVGPASTIADGQGVRDLLAFRPGVDSEAAPLVATPEYAEQAPAISRDGRWLAYVSNETGRQEVFVRPFPNVDDGKWQISTDGGIAPLWARTGNELFYVDGERNIVSVPYQAESTFDPGAQERLFTLSAEYRVAAAINTLDISADDQRFLVGRDLSGAGSTDGEAPTLVVVNNFFAELERLVPRD